MWRIKMLSMATIAAGVVGGCATEGSQPTQQLTRAQTLVEQAEKAQAQRYAPQDLQRARDELAAAETASSTGKYDAARSDAQSAAVDADLATARASAAEAKRASREADQSNATLQQESEHRNGGSAPPPPTPRSDLEAYPPAPPAAMPSPPETQPNPH